MDWRWAARVDCRGSRRCDERLGRTMCVFFCVVRGYSHNNSGHTCLLIVRPEASIFCLCVCRGAYDWVTSSSQYGPGDLVVVHMPLLTSHIPKLSHNGPGPLPLFGHKPRGSIGQIQRLLSLQCGSTPCSEEQRSGHEPSRVALRSIDTRAVRLNLGLSRQKRSLPLRDPATRRPHVGN